MKLTLLDPNNANELFPSLKTALTDPNGLLAAGGCLSATRLINAYKQGVFPWFNPDEPILWWSPDPRLILTPLKLKISRSLAKTIRQQPFELTVDKAFIDVINACAMMRKYTQGTWISEEMKQAYTELHHQGIAHSAEAWLDGELVGGLYGVAIGQVFFGESMFHTHKDASKIVFTQLVKKLQLWDYQLIDCQVHSDHLASLGAYEISRKHFIEKLTAYCCKPPAPTAWSSL